MYVHIFFVCLFSLGVGKDLTAFSLLVMYPLEFEIV